MTTGSVDTRVVLPRAEAARLCGVSLDTIRRRLRAGAFPNAARVGEDQHWVIPVSDLLDAGLTPRAGELPATTQPDFEPAPVPAAATGVTAHVEVEVLRAELARAQDEIAFLRSLVAHGARVA